jgi:hypothetical protein
VGEGLHPTSISDGSRKSQRETVVVKKDEMKKAADVRVTASQASTPTYEEPISLV